MEYNRLGKTDLTVSRLAFGAASLGDPRKQISRADSLKTVKTALDGGINLIDVSPYYGATEAERIVGEGIAGWPRDKVIIATKAGRYGAEDFDFSPERLERSVDESLERLGTDYIDIMQLHDIEFSDLDYIVGESIPALHKLKQSGKIRYAGVTAYPIKTLGRVLETAEVDTVLSHCRYSLNDTSLEALRPVLKETDVGLLHASPFSMGLLTQRGPFPWHPAPAILKDACKRAAEFCKDRDADIARLAVQFSLLPSWIPTTIVGSSNPRAMERNLRWVDEEIDEELLSAVRLLFKPVQNLAWRSGRPENNDPQSQQEGSRQ